MDKQTAIIIGAGIGGLATAVQLAKQGYDVTIYEKTDKAGGRCQQIIRDGHIFDTGPTMYIFPEIYEEFFKSIGDNIYKYITLIQTKPTYKLHFSDNTDFVLSSDLGQMRVQLETMEPHGYKKLVRYLDAGKKLYDIAVNGISKKALHKPQEYFNGANVRKILTSGALIPHHLFTRLFFKNPKLRIAFTFQDSYLSLNPYTAPAIFSLFTYAELTKGNFLPEGGMYQIILGLLKLAQKRGVKIVCSAPVSRINVDHTKVTGITLENGESISSDLVVANADLPFVYQKLLPPEPYAVKLTKKQYSSSALVFHWALDKEYPQLETHNLFFTEEYNKGFKEVLDKSTPPATPHFYVQAPSRTDKSRAPEGQDTWSVMIPINKIDPNNPIDWKKYRDEVRSFVFTRLAQAGLADVEKHVKFEVCYLPTDWQNYLNLTNGSVYGLHHNLFQIGYFRPSRQHKKYKNLYFVGADTHPGSGLPTVLLSSKYTVEKILETAGK